MKEHLTPRLATHQSSGSARLPTILVGLLLVFAAILLASCGQAYQYKGTLYPEDNTARDFELMADDGQTYRLSDHRGQVVLVFFGYTGCPDVCPMTLSEAKQVLEGLGDDAEGVQFIFITVDPERDTAEQLGRYTKAFHPKIVGLTGDPEELARIRDAYGVVAEKEELSDSALGYVVNHTARVFLVDPEGNLKLSYRFGTEPADVLADVQYLLRSAGAG